MVKKKNQKIDAVYLECEGGQKFLSVGERAKKAVDHALVLLKKNNVALRLFLIGNISMRRLNKEFRGKDRPTTVLSFEAGEEFPYPEAGETRSYIGEIYLAPRYIAGENESVERMAVHGCLHLLGYTHKKKSDRMEMERQERRVLLSLKKKNPSPK